MQMRMYMESKDGSHLENALLAEFFGVKNCCKIGRSFLRFPSSSSAPGPAFGLHSCHGQDAPQLAPVIVNRAMLHREKIWVPFFPQSLR